MSQELELFNEDAQEQLNYMETALVKMQEEGADEDDIGALFRGMHTIKGTAGMFGFDDIVSFTHVAESLLGEVREGNVVMSEEMIDLFLEVKDHTEKLVDAAINETAIDDELRRKNDELMSRLSGLMPKEGQESHAPESSSEASDAGEAFEEHAKEQSEEAKQQTTDYEKLTIQEVLSFQKMLIGLLDGSKERCELDLSNIEKLDMAGIQLLLSAKKSFREKAVSLKIKGLNEDCLDYIRLCGCEPYIGDAS